MNKENVYIIIPVHNRKDITINCLNNLVENFDMDRYHVIVVDDGSTDGTSEVIRSLYPDVIILMGDGNMWWTGAIAMGMEYAYKQGAEYFIWLNDDCLAAKQAINDLVIFCKENTNTIIGYQGYQSEDYHQIAFGGLRKNRQVFRYFNTPLFELINCPQDKILECDLLGGNLVCLPKTIVDIIGYPKGNLYPHYLGDFIYLTIAQKKGFTIYVSNQHFIVNHCSDRSPLDPEQWLFQKGSPWEIAKLVFIPQSLLSWRAWFAYHLSEYGSLLGILTFIIYYGRQYFIPIILITILRFLPLSMRELISRIKRKITLNQY